MWEVRRSSPAPMQLRVSILKPKFGSPLTSRRCICSTRSQETGCPTVLQFPRSVKIFLKSEPVWALCASGGSLDILPRGSVTTESPPALRARQEIRCTFCCWPPGPLARRERRAYPLRPLRYVRSEQRSQGACGPQPGGARRRASAALPLLDDVTTSPASRRLASARPALAPKCTPYFLTGPNLGHGRDGHATKRRSVAFDETMFEEITGQPKSVQLGSGNMIEEPAGRLGCGTAPKSHTVIVEPWL